MSGKLANKVAVITGGTTGIGLASAKRFAAEGAKVVVTGNNPDTLEAARKELGDNATVMASNAGDPAAVKQLFDDIGEKHGKIDVLFLNAGIAKFAPWDEASEEFYDLHFNINVKGPWMAIKHASPLLNDGASIIATTSVVNRMAMPGSSVYSATKAALHQVIRNAATEFAPRGIRANSVSPGPIETPIFGKVGMPAEEMDQMAAQFTQMISLGRMGQADEVANLALFLASDESSFVTGQEYAVDGGMTF